MRSLLPLLPLLGLFRAAALLIPGGRDGIVLPSPVGLAMRLSGAGVRIETCLSPKTGHVGVLTAMAGGFRSKAPILADLGRFARDVTQAE